MKTPFASFALRRAALVVASATGAALATPVQAQQAGAPAGVQQVSDFAYRVWASNPTAQPGQVQLVELSTGRVLYEERTKAVSFGQKFDVSQLPDGRYAFVVNVGPRKFSYSLNLRTAAVRSAELRADTVRARVALSARL